MLIVYVNNMKNPFDQNFFKFILGFSFILCASFLMMLFVGQYSTSLNSQQVKVLQTGK